MKVRNFLFVILCLGLFNACANDALQDSKTFQNSLPLEFTINQARTSFESVIGDCLEAYSKTNYSSDKLFPGEYIPDWKNAKRLQESNHTIVVCPILSSRRIITVGASFRNNKSLPFISDVKQFLVFQYDKEKSVIHIVLRSMIADQSSFNYDNQMALLCRDQFSGLICDHNLTGKLVYAKRTICGRIIAQAGSANLSSLLRTIGVFKICNTKKTSTRSYGEDDWDDDWDDGNNDNSEGVNIPNDPTTWTDDYWAEQTRPGGSYDNENENGSGAGEEDPDQDIVVVLRHDACGTIVGYVLLDDIENGIYYCPKCKKNVYFCY